MELGHLMSPLTARGLADLARASRRVALLATRRPTLLRDEYIDWLLLVNAGMQHPGNIHLFDLAMRTAPRAPMLEIGSFCGLSANIIQYLKRKHARSERLFTCDSWVFEGSQEPLPDAAGVSRGGVRDFVRESCERSLRVFSAEDLPSTIEATSDEFFRRWSAGERASDIFGRAVTLGGPLGFCFIDGNHTEEHALRDFRNCDRHLVPGGLILFDDSSDESEWEVRKVIRRIKRSDRYEVVARNPNYLVRKRAQQ
jgi:predicted O-methyltransferase YrrM